MRIVRSLAVLASVAAASTVLAVPAAEAASIAWERCAGAPTDDQVRCGKVSVPVDWSRPASPNRLDVRVARLPAGNPKKRVGTLFFNPGGPGQGAVGYLAAKKVRELYFPARLRERFDIVAVEPRGTGLNDPLRCPPPLDATVTRFPDDVREARALVASNRRLGERCVEAGGDVTSHLDTGSVARDLDEVRAALGEPQVSFLGVSYGTMLAQSYAEQFPDRVRAMVLDGVVDRSRSWRRLVEDDARAVEDGVTRLGVRSTVTAALRRADEGRVEHEGRKVRAEDVAQAVNAGLNEPQLRDELVRGLREVADDGDFTRLAPFTSAANPDYALYRAIICQDVPVTAADAYALPAEARRLARLAPTLRGYSEFWDIVAGCVGWPTPARWRPHAWRVPADFPPPLLLSGAHDVATPRVWARGVQRGLPGSRLVCWDGDGHAAWPVHDGDAVRAAVDHLVEGRASG